MLALRAALTIAPNMWLWGFNTQRFLPTALAWGLWGLWASSLHPAVGRRLTDAIARLGEAVRVRRSARVGFALVLCALVLWLQDNTWFFGDFLIRRRGGGMAAFAGNFEQSLPLEVLLYDRAPRLLSSFLPEPSMLHRMLGALSVIAVVLASMSLARLFGKSAAITAAGAVGIAFGGYMLVATGLGKPAALLCACVAMVATSVCVEKPGWSELARVGGVAGSAILLHRSGLLLIPCWGLAVLEVLKRPEPRPSARQVLAAGLPLVALAAMGPRLWHILTSFDIPHHLGGQSLAGLDHRWSVRSESLRALDLVNLCYLFVPALPFTAMAIGAAARRGSMDPRVRRLWVLALPWLAAMVAIRPQQGLFRDLDVFAPGGVAIAALVSAFILARPETPRSDPRSPAVMVLAAVVPTIQILLLHHDPAHGLKRVAAYASEAPHREEADIARTWDFLALRSFALRDWPGAAAATAHAVSYSSSPRLLIMQGISNVYVGDYETATGAYQQAVSRDPDLAEAWLGLAGAAMYRGDRVLADSAMVRLRFLSQSRKVRSTLRQLLLGFPAIVPSSERSRLDE